MPRSLLCPTLLLVLALAAAACETETAPPVEAADEDTTQTVVDVPEPEEVIEGADELLGTWTIIEQAGSAPEDHYTVTLTRDGEYLVRDEAGTTERSRFRLVDDGTIAVTDSSGTHRFNYDVDGITLTLSIPNTGNATVLERR